MAVVFFISVRVWHRAPAARPGALPARVHGDGGPRLRPDPWTEMYEGSPQMVAGQHDHTGMPLSDVIPKAP
ncbi:MAG TPA: hypothetical protein VGO40_17450, partial [Longimicrobium sp.]|nr:hypothetical protein [Longimicrobium sp.]